MDIREGKVRENKMVKLAETDTTNSHLQALLEFVCLFLQA